MFSIPRIGGMTPLSWRIQAVGATMGFSEFDSSRCMAWAGVIPPSVLRGRLLSSVATSNSRAGEWIVRSVPFGDHSSNPFVFSLVPRRQSDSAPAGSAPGSRTMIVRWRGDGTW